jgi:carbonic anhydrase
LKDFSGKVTVTTVCAGHSTMSPFRRGDDPFETNWLGEVSYRFAFNTPSQEAPKNAEAARLRLEAGNRAFADLFKIAEAGKPARMNIDVNPHDVGLLPESSAAPRQLPFAAVLGCADARVPVELLFAEGPNDLFVVRVAGNGLGDDVLGSLTYAVEHLTSSLRTIVVLGHSECGAVSAAVDVHLQPGGYLSVMAQKPLREILDRMLIVASVGASWLEIIHGPDVSRRPGHRAALIEVAIALNAALTAHGIGKGLESARQNGIKTVYGIYLLEDRLVWSPYAVAQDCFRLSEAPGNRDEFVDLCKVLVSCARIVSLLDRQ